MIGGRGMRSGKGRRTRSLSQRWTGSASGGSRLQALDGGSYPGYLKNARHSTPRPRQIITSTQWLVKTRVARYGGSVSMALKDVDGSPPRRQPGFVHYGGK